MISSRFLTSTIVGFVTVGLVACGGGAATPASSSGAAVSAAASKPAAAASAPAASASAKPAASAAASAKPVASGAASAKPAASGAASGSAAAKPGLTKLKAAYSQTSAVQAPMYVAVDQGFFNKYGLDMDVSQVSGTAQVPAMTAGELQFGTPGGNELVSADLGGAGVVMIAVASNYPLFSLFGGKGINTMQDLAGKSVAITTAGSSTDATARLFLKHYGLDKQVKLQPAATIEGILATVEKGDAAGGVVSPPTTVIATKDGLKELVNGPALGDPLVHSGVTVTRDYLKNKPDMVKAFLQGYLDGWNFAVNPANQAAMVQTISKWTKTDAATAKDAYDYALKGWSKDKIPAVNPQGIETIFSLIDVPGASTAKAADFIDNSIINSLAK